MTRDDRLRTELDALERSAPDAAPPIADARRSRRWALGLVAGTVIGAAALTAVAVGPLRSLPLGAVSPSPNPPATAETQVGEFILTISSPKTEWTSEEAIEVLASLKYVGDQSDMTIGQGIPPVMFTVASASGEGPTLGGAQIQPCAQYPVSAEEPVVVGMQSGGFLAVEDGRPVEPRPPYDRIIADDAGLHLPPGDWKLTAHTQFDERTCGDAYSLQVSIVLRVITQSSVSPVPIVAATPTPLSTPTPAPSGSLVAVPTSPPLRGSDIVCEHALLSGTLIRDEGSGFIVRRGSFDFVVRWPYGYVARDTSEGRILLDFIGQVVAREGDAVQLAGGGGEGEFTTCGFPPAFADVVDCHLPGIDCYLALAAAKQLVQDDMDPRRVMASWGRGLRVWHAEVHVCWDDGRYQLIDVIGPGGIEGLTINDVSATDREVSWDDPPCD